MKISLEPLVSASELIDHKIDFYVLALDTLEDLTEDEIEKVIMENDNCDAKIVVE